MNLPETCKQVSRRAIAKCALAYLGRPYSMHGRGEKVDCVAVVTLPARDAGHDIEDEVGYSGQPHEGILVQRIAAKMDEISAADASVGDVLAMCWGSRLPSHVAMIVGHTEDGTPMVMHATNDSQQLPGLVGEVRMDALTGVLRRRVHSAFRYRNTVE